MRIVKVIKSEFEEIETDEITYLNRYRRLGEMQWEHYLGHTHQWLEFRFCDLMEDLYQKWVREQRTEKTNL